MQGRYGFVVLLLLACSGCVSEEPQIPPETGPRAGDRFVPAECGTVHGQVLWQGSLPDVPPLTTSASPLGGPGSRPARSFPNPYRPRIHSTTRGVAGALVVFQGVDPRRARPWELPPVTVALREERFVVSQGEDEVSLGLVHQGDPVTLVSRSEKFYSVQARGAAFFHLTFPNPDQPRLRPVPHVGAVEVTSASGLPWARAILWASDHPCVDLTEMQGNFRIHNIPSGDYEVLCWLPHWRPVRHERDPESSAVARFVYAPPLEARTRVTIQPGTDSEIRFLLEGQ